MLTDKQIILKIKSGEIEYFSLIFKRYYPLIKKFIWERVFEKEEVDDLIQETFFKFYRAITKFDENKKIVPYLLQIAKNEIKNYYRSKKSTIFLKEEIFSKFYLDNDRVKDRTDFENYLKYLKDEEKKIFLMLIDGFTYNEIAKKLKRPVNTIKSIVRRARKKLKINNE
ncbi:MAG: RNA polymerase sigma factor [Microgenomates group bacterium]